MTTRRNAGGNMKIGIKDIEFSAKEVIAFVMAVVPILVTLIAFWINTQNTLATHGKTLDDFGKKFEKYDRRFDKIDDRLNIAHDDPPGEATSEAAPPELAPWQPLPIVMASRTQK